MQDLQLHGHLFNAEIQRIEKIREDTMKLVESILKTTPDDEKIPLFINSGEQNMAKVYYLVVVKLQKEYINYLFERSPIPMTTNYAELIEGISNTAKGNIRTGFPEFRNSEFVVIIKQTWMQMYQQFVYVSWLLI